VLIQRHFESERAAFARAFEASQRCSRSVEFAGEGVDERRDTSVELIRRKVRISRDAHEA
jgi:hypothetical protein